MLAGGAMAEKYLIDHEVWGWYQQYLRSIGNGTKPGAFAITRDGQAAFYSWCQDIRCVAGTTYSQDALNYCEREYDTDCVVFAVRDDIKVEYEIVGAPEVGNQPPPDLAPAPVTRLSVSPDVKSKIDAYLRNAQRAGRTWALAIAKDGSRAESASCQIVGNNYGSGPCNRVQGPMQDLANREAVKRCGGADDCIVLYAGDKKTANIEIVVQ